MKTPAAGNRSYTLAAAFKERVRLTPAKTAYIEYNPARRSWRHYCWREVQELAASIQKQLLASGLQCGDRLALMLSNSVMWVAIDQAAAGLGMITVPLYPNDRKDNVRYILEQVDCRLLLIETQRQYRLSKHFVREIKSLENIILVKPIAGLNVPVLEKPCAQTAAGEFRCDGCDSHDPATIVFTSGTSGRPKGVVLTHQNLLANAQAAGRAVPVGTKDRLVSFLPLSHTFERTAGYYAPMLYGAEIAYARSIDRLAEDLQIMRPTILISVPRIYERVFARIEEQLQKKSGPAQRLFTLTHQIGYRRFCYRQARAGWSLLFLLHPVLDWLIARKIRAILGGRLVFAVAGGAALAARLNAFFIGMGINVLQGYGLTESAPVIATNRIDNNIVGSVGFALDNVEVKLSAGGELLARGASIMPGYWRDQAASEAVLDRQGWLHTGDLARIENAAVYIIGRVKDIIVLSNGEKISPADVEQAICAGALFDQAIVIGEGRPFLSAIVVLNRQQCQRQGINVNDLGSDAVRQALLQRIAKHMHAFPGYARIYQVSATVEAWQLENGLLTPTLKIKREKVKDLFKREIERMYARH